MSPDDAALRRSLPAGEGAGIDPDAVIAAALTARRQRRSRLAGVAASVVTVLGIALAVVALSRRDGTPNAVPRTSPTASPGQVCRADPPARGEAGSQTAEVVPPDVVSMTVCVYSSRLEQPASTLISNRILGPAEARALAGRINRLTPPKPGTMLCPNVVVLRMVRLLPMTAAGPAAPVTMDGTACGLITNGTASRIDRTILLELAGGPGSGGPIGTVGPGGHTMSHGPGPS